jgi:hypothetical protein
VCDRLVRVGRLSRSRETMAQYSGEIGRARREWDSLRRWLFERTEITSATTAPVDGLVVELANGAAALRGSTPLASTESPGYTAV